MTITARVSHLAKIINISIIAFAGLGISSCTYRTEFEGQYGFKRSDYFGNFGTSNRRNYVPAEVQKPQYYTPEHRTRIGHPAHDPRLSTSGGPIR
jgi:hypothetical protein